MYGALEPDFRSFLDGCQAARVLCLGDLMLDRFVHGRVERVSAEAPIQILHISSQRTMLGGVGNVGRNVVALGAEAVLVTVIGDDASAQQISDLVESEDQLTSRLIVEAGRQSTVKTRFIAGGQQLLRTDDEVTTPISDETARRVIAAIRAELRDADVMVLSDYMKGVLTDHVLDVAIAEARAAGVPVIADPKREDFRAYSGVTILKPNVAELAAATRLPCGNDAEVEASARMVISDCGIEAVMISRSERGMSIVPRDDKARHFAAKAREVFDVSGAGDTVVATTAVALAAGAEFDVAAELANVAGGLVVSKLGTAVVGRAELAAALRAPEASSSEGRVTSAETALDAVHRWRLRGQKIGFAFGCFDLLHPGHVSLLTEARAACDRLVVAVNSDESVKRLKGRGRPCQHQTARATVLASLGMVDLVVIVSDDAPTSLLELLRPDLLIKGGDFTIGESIGADLVRAYGGEVKLAALVPGHSSSEVIAKMSNGDAPRGRRGALRRST